MDLKTLPPWKTIPGEIGMGVNVGAISRLREFFLDARARSTGATAEYSAAGADLLIQTEQALGEPDAGVRNALIAVYDGLRRADAGTQLPRAARECAGRAGQVLAFRDEAWQTYFANPDYLRLVEARFGAPQRANVEAMSNIPLRRRLLGHAPPDLRAVPRPMIGSTA